VPLPTTMFLEINSRRLPLEPGQLYLLGKETDVNKNFDNKYFIHLEKDEVNQKHCVIDVGHSDNIYIYDLFSSQGTLLNNRLIKTLEKVRLKNGDVIKVGQQEITFYHQQPEVSRDSSGFLEVNKNTSGVITSSPESTSQLENDSKRTGSNNFLVPSIPSRKSAGTPNTSIVRPEFDLGKSRNSLNVSSDTSNRRSDSFTIPDTQYCKPRISLNGSDYSIAESIPEANVSKIKFNFGNLDDDDDEFCIPETQEVMPISSSQRPRLLSEGKKPQEKTVIEERTAELEAEDSTNEMDGSQFRICTQDYNEGFGEETGSLHSQIIPLIKHKAVVLNTNSVSIKDTSKNQTQLENDKEISAIKWSADKGDQETTSLRPDCSTPDIFDFDDIEQNKQPSANEQIKKMPPKVLEEDEEDLLPTQVFSLEKPKHSDEKTLNVVDKPCLEKENEEILTLSDKENRCPVTLDPVTDFPPTQLFATNEAPSARSALSNSSRSSSSSAAKLHSFTIPAPTPSTSNKPTENKNNPKLLLNLDSDDEDDLLTQAFLLPSKPETTSTITSDKTVPVKCFNSTLLGGKSVDKNPAIFFAELEKAPLKQVCTTAATDTFKVPDKELLVPRKTPSSASVTSDNDLDLLMCTPLLIKERLHVDKEDDLRKNILAAKNKDLFGDDTDEEETSDGQTDLVKLINVPKEFRDFDKLLPHLKSDKEETKKKENEEQKLAKETQKKYKFNIPFGKELEAQQPTTSKSIKSSRDERHMARDREREREEKIYIKKDTKEKTIESNDSEKQERMTRKRNKLEVLQDEANKKSKDSKQIKSTEKESISSEGNSTKNSIETRSNNSKHERTAEDNNESLDTHAAKRKRGPKAKKGEEKQTKKSETTSNSSIRSEKPEKPLPVRRMTRSKSITENKASTASSADHINKSKTKASHNEKESGDDMDSVSTQPFVRIRRCRSRSKNSESQHSLTSSSSMSKSTHGSETSLSYNTSLNGSVTKTERKRKEEPTLVQTPVKVERKRLRSTHSLDSIGSTLTLSHTAGNVCISTTMVDPELLKKLVKDSNGFWKMAMNPAESEILVMDKAFRTFKFLLAMARGIPIVTSDYLRKINEMQSIKKVPIVDYLFSDPEFEKKHKFSLVKSLHMAQKQKLFKGYEFLMTANILPNPSEIKAIIEASGGLVHHKSPPESKEGQKIYLVSSTDDKKEWHKYRRLNKNIVIVSTEAIMSAIMRQTCARMSNYELS
ncbi:hypothetical protein DOY81_002009, partial [Sarcophaga bullata]